MYKLSAVHIYVVYTVMHMNHSLYKRANIGNYTFLLLGALGASAFVVLLDNSFFNFEQMVSAISLFPFFILGGNCGTGCGSDNNNCDGYGNSGTNCQCNCSGCCGNNGCASAGSTPFLYIKTKNGFEMDNDVMFGKPSSFFATIEEGLEAHKAGLVKPDLYIVQKKFEIVDGKIQFQIKEIEPEVSMISSVAFYRIPVRKNETLITLANFSGCIRVQNSNKQTLTCYDKEKKDITKQLELVDDKHITATQNSITLETRDFIEIEFDAKVGEEKYLLLQSWYRDWTLGSVYSEVGTFDSYVSPYQKVLNTLKTRTARGLLSGVTASVVGYLGLTANFSASDDASLLSSKFGFGTKSIEADSCSSCIQNCSRKSLEVSYGQCTMLEVVEPRYARPSTVAMLVPQECIKNGKAKIRITATKRHKVSGISVVDGIAVASQEFDLLSLDSAYHHRDKKDYKDTFNSNKESNGGNYVQTCPSDVITLTFDAKNNQEEAYEYLVSVSGVYAMASKEVQLKMGDWTKKLDDEALAFLSKVYYQSDSSKKA